MFGADILYQLTDHEPVLRTVKALLAPGGVALLSDPNRRVADRVPELAGQHGFIVEVEPVRGLNPATGREAAGRIFHLRAL